MKDVEYFRQLISHRFKFGEIKEALRVQKNELERMKIMINI
jgi:hypothetical protein